MKIIKNGVLPSTKEYTATCRNCKCEFTFERGEAKLNTADPRERAHLEIECPTRGCTETVTVYP